MSSICSRRSLIDCIRSISLSAGRNPYRRTTPSKAVSTGGTLLVSSLSLYRIGWPWFFIMWSTNEGFSPNSARSLMQVFHCKFWSMCAFLTCSLILTRVGSVKLLCQHVSSGLSSPMGCTCFIFLQSPRRLVYCLPQRSQFTVFEVEANLDNILIQVFYCELQSSWISIAQEKKWMVLDAVNLKVFTWIQALDQVN